MSSPSVNPFLIPSSSDRPGDDPIFALNAEAKRRAHAGESVLNATLGALMEDDGKLAILPTALEAVRTTPNPEVSAYAPILGTPRFLEAVRHDLLGSGGAFAASVACATPGGSGALHSAVVHFLEPGQALLVPHLYWGPYRTFVDHTGRKLSTFSMFDAEGRFDTAALDRSLHELERSQGRALVVINSPCNNPTGYSLDAEEWASTVEVLRQAARRFPVVLIVDHAYARFAAQDDDTWLHAVEPALGELLVLVAWTASKSHTLYGARVGALVAIHPDERVRKQVENALAFSCRGTWSNCNHGGMAAVARLLGDPTLRAAIDQERETLRTLLLARVDAFNQAAQGAGLRYPRYEGGFFVTVFADRPAEAAKHMRERGVFVVPAAGALRVALCSTPVAAVPRLVEALKLGLEA